MLHHYRAKRNLKESLVEVFGFSFRHFKYKVMVSCQSWNMQKWMEMLWGKIYGYKLRGFCNYQHRSSSSECVKSLKREERSESHDLAKRDLLLVEQRANNQENTSQKLKERISKGWRSVRVSLEAAKWLSDSLKEKDDAFKKTFT